MRICVLKPDPTETKYRPNGEFDKMNALTGQYIKQL